VESQGGTRGIVTVLNTPFSPENDIDEAGLRRHVRYALAAGVSGFLVPAMASEVHALSPDERESLVRVTCEEAAGRAHVIGGVSSPVRGERMAASTRFLELGCAGLLFNATDCTPDELEADLQALSDLGPRFIMLQDWNAEGYGLPLETILHLFDAIPAFTWLKVETQPAGPKYTEVLNATKGGLQVAGGWAVREMLDGLDRGVHAFMPTGLHGTYVRICGLHAAGKRDEALALFQRVLPILTFSNQGLDTSIRFFKRLLHVQGIYATDRCRPPVAAFGARQARIADGLIAQAIALEQEASPHAQGA